MPNLKLKHKILLTTLAVFSGLLLIVFAIILPTVNYIKNIRIDIEMTESQLEEKYQKARLLKKSINELEKVKADIQKFDDIKVERGNELLTISSLEHLASEHNIAQDLSVTLHEETDNPYYTFSFQNNGSFQNHMNYLSSLEQLPYYMIIDKPSWNKLEKENQQSVVLNFEGKIYSK